MCCDKCPKVFHQNCHLPVVSTLPDESEPWQCLLCYNFADMPLGKLKMLLCVKTLFFKYPFFYITEPVFGDKRSAGLSAAEFKRIQRILLELYCQNEHSFCFRDLEPETNRSYYEIVRK